MIFATLRKTRYLCLSILLVLLSGCKKPELNTYTYSPYDGITFNVTLKKLESKPEHKSTFLYFDLTIKNESSKRLYFNPGEVKAKLNGVSNDFVYYDSLASVEPRKKELVKGVSNYHLYFVFQDTVGHEVSSFVVTDFGLSE